MSTLTHPRVGVVLVNWRGWRDTQLALETLFAGDYLHFDAVVVDNDSGDDSVEHILAWAQGVEAAVRPTVLEDKVLLRAEQAAVPYTLFHEHGLETAPAPHRLTVIQSTRNGGFAAGNNLGIRYLQKQGGYDYFWLLNNDAYPAPDALTQLVTRASATPNMGLIGSTLVFADQPDVVQALGGATFEPITGRARHIGAIFPLARLSSVDVIETERNMAYVVGASMLVSSRYLEVVGLMREDYFLYFEEIDWAERGKPDFRLGYAKDSIVYHKAGGSTQIASRRSEFAAYYLARNRLVFTRRFYPDHLSSVFRALVIETFRYLVRARWNEAKGFGRAVFEGIKPQGSEGRQ